MDRQKLAYGPARLSKAARTFRKLSCTYMELSRELPSYLPATKAIATQLEEMAAVLEEYTGVDCREVSIEISMEAQIEKILGSKGIKVGTMSLIERGDGHQEFMMTLKCVRNGGSVTSYEVAGVVSKVLKKDFLSAPDNRFVINGNFNDFSFLECGRFDTLYGVARANKNGNAVSGDNFSVNQLNCGKIIISLVDGMGSGDKACQESRRVVELLEQSIEAGFREESAIELINSVFSVNDMVGMPVTVDMCVIDTFLGVCNCIKLGAASTYIRRKGWVDVIESNTMPIGVLPDIDYDSTTKKLYDGDYIVMVSDGVMEALPFLEKEEVLMEIIAGVRARKPEQMAEEILSDALNYIGEYPNDDMTIIVIGVFERTIQWANTCQKQ